MKRHFQVELLSDAIMPSHYGTVNFGAGLNYIPGTMFLGVAAAKLYQTLNREDPTKAHCVFHSGRFRFGNGLPLTPEGLPTFPVPRCWHDDKNGQPALEGAKLLSNRLVNHPVSAMAQGIQPRPLKTGFVAMNGRLVRPQVNFRLKNAMDPERLRNADHQVFGSYSLVRGQSFSFWLEADEGPDTSRFFEQVAEALGGEIRIGRSRSAEYGAASCRPIETEDPRKPPVFRNDPKEVLLWLISDLALHSHAGVPDLLPSPANLGLPEGYLDLKASFLHFRRFDLFNGYRKRREQERLVIGAGSVLVFRLEKEPQLESLGKLQRGIGLYRQYGLGEVWVNPPLLCNGKPEFPATLSETRAPVIRVEKPDHPLVIWLERRARRERDSAAQDRMAMNWIEELRQLYHQARQFQSHGGRDLIGPGASQWGRIMEAAQSHRRNLKGLEEALFDHERAICHGKDPDWKLTVSAETTTKGGVLATFGSWLRTKVSSADPMVVGIFAREAVRLVRELEAIQKTSDGEGL